MGNCVVAISSRKSSAVEPHHSNDLIKEHVEKYSCELKITDEEMSLESGLEEFENEEKYGKSKRFKWKELQSATNFFDEKYLLGQGSFGKVYKGYVESKDLDTLDIKVQGKVAVAVKKLNPESVQGYREWLAEVLLLNKVHHPNLIKLLGYSLEKGEAALVYEHCVNGSLENALFPLDDGPIIPWRKRVEIAFGAAEGLAFLHKNNIIHRDFKSSNILLDENFEAKVTDFGLARTGPEENETHISTQVMGTQGYLDPTYMETGRLTLHSDTYAFGVVLLELVSGNRTFQDAKLTTWASPYLKDHHPNIEKLIDYRLNGNFVFTEALKMAILAKLCISDDPLNRPEMSTVVGYLRKILRHKPAS